jgi:hypothetical protein
MTINIAPFAQTSVAEWDSELARLFHPGRFYERPKDVLDDAELSLEQQRAVLALWASDACAVDSVPALRRAPFCWPLRYHRRDYGSDNSPG